MAGPKGIVARSEGPPWARQDRKFWVGCAACPKRATSAFPAELWGRAAPWLLPGDFVRLSRCTSELFLEEELQKLWRLFCYAHRYVRTAAGALSIAAGRDVCRWPGPQVDWQRSFRVNAEADASGGSRVFACVLVRQEELRVPCLASEGEDCGASPRQRWLCERGWRDVGCLSRALREMLFPCSAALRLRELIAGRPGNVLRRAAFHGGAGPASAVLEWPLGRAHDGAWRWFLPPHAGESEAAEGGDKAADREALVGPRPLGRGDGWLLQLVSEEPEPRRRWVHVGASKPASALTLRELCRELRQHLPSLGFAWDAEVLPAGTQQPSGPLEPEAAEPRWRLHADLRWTQGEELRLLTAPCAPGGGAPGRGPPARPPTVLFQRVAARPPTSWAPPAQDAEAHTLASGSLGSRGSDIGDNEPVRHTQRLLLSSSGTCQFEFHPTRRGTMLAGREDGVVAVLDHEADVRTHELQVGPHPILGLSWLRTQPQWAVVGASHAGTMCFVRYDESTPGSMERVDLEPFPDLSSLSVNCTDDYLMASGFCVDAAVYDVVTGRCLKQFRDMHDDFVLSLRCAHLSPHLFATSSCDETCKVWDLRVPTTASRPLRIFSTDTESLMCCFSPDDGNILCSGVDGALQQFSLQTDHNAAGSRFPVPPLHSDRNHRLSAYAAQGSLVATAGTSESLLRVYSAAGPHRLLGSVDFRGALPGRRCASGGADAWGQDALAAPAAALGDGIPAMSEGGALDAVGPRAGSALVECVESLRADPGDPLLLGALLSTCGPQPEPYVAALHLGF